MTSYKASVNQHFEKTSELVGDLTQSYVKVYQHLAEGSEALGGGKTFTNLLEQHQRESLGSPVHQPNVVEDTAEPTPPDQIVVEPVDTSAVVIEPTTGDDMEDIDEHAAPFIDPSVAAESDLSKDDPPDTLAASTDDEPEVTDRPAEAVDIDVGAIGGEEGVQGEAEQQPTKKSPAENKH